jgi:hypothetical protein
MSKYGSTGITLATTGSHESDPFVKQDFFVNLVKNIFKNPDYTIIYSGMPMEGYSAAYITPSGSLQVYCFPEGQPNIEITHCCSYCGIRDNFDKRGFCLSCGAPVGT